MWVFWCFTCVYIWVFWLFFLAMHGRRGLYIPMLNLYRGRSRNFVRWVAGSIKLYWSMMGGWLLAMHTYQPADKLLLEICIKHAWYGTFLLENAASFSKLYGPDLSQVITKVRDLVLFGGMGTINFLLDIQAKSWMVGRYGLAMAHQVLHTKEQVEVGG